MTTNMSIETTRMHMEQAKTPQARLDHAKNIVKHIKATENKTPFHDQLLLELRKISSSFNDFPLREQLAKALFYTHLSMCNSDGCDTTILLNELRELSSREIILQKILIKALINEIINTKKSNNLESEKILLDEIQSINETYDDREIRDKFSKAILSVLYDAIELKKYDDIKSLLDKLRFFSKTYNEVQIHERLAKALAKSHLSAIKLDLINDADTLLIELRELKEAHDEPGTREQLARALVNDHLNAGNSKDWGKANERLHELRGLAKNYDELTLSERLAHALVNAHIDAGDLKEWAKADELLSELRMLSNKFNEASFRERLAHALVNAHIDAGDSKEWIKADELLDELRRLTRKHKEPRIRERLALALSNAHFDATDSAESSRADDLLNELRKLTNKFKEAPLRDQLAYVLVHAHKDALDSKLWSKATSLLKEIQILSDRHDEKTLHVALATAFVNTHRQATNSLANDKNRTTIRELCAVSKEHSESTLKTILDDLDLKQLTTAEVVLEKLRILNSKHEDIQITECLAAVLSTHHFSILKKDQGRSEKILNELEKLHNCHKNGLILKNYYEALDIASEHYSDSEPDKSQELYTKATTIFNKLTEKDIELLSPRDRCKYRILSVIKGFSHCQDSFVQKMDQREERTKNFLLAESHFQGIKSLLFVLRQWNSYTPILVEDQEYDRGGGYFIYHCNSAQQKIGLVIDPGYNFIENFHRACCRIHDITHIAITHAHDDHTAQLEQLFTLMYQYNSKNNKENNKPPKQITLLLNHSVLKKFSGFDMYKESPYIKDVITLNAFDEKNIQRISLAKDFSLTVLPAYHNDIYSRNYAVGFGIEIGERDHYKKIVFTGDTGLFPPLERTSESKNNKYNGKYKDTLKVDEREGKEVYLHYPRDFEKKPDLLIPHIGSIQKYEFKPRSTVEIPMFYPNHLGLLGTALLINHIWPTAVILSEFGAELRDIRAEMTQILQQSLSAATCGAKNIESVKKVSLPREETNPEQSTFCNTEIRPYIFPGDPTIVYNILNGKFLCHGDGAFLPPEELEFKDVDGGHIGLFQKGKPCATIQPFFKALDNKRHNSSEKVCGISLDYFTD